MKFDISISSADAALTEDPAGELSRILDTVKEMLINQMGWDGEETPQSGRVLDINGNDVGAWKYAPES